MDMKLNNFQFLFNGIIYMLLGSEYLYPLSNLSS